jgi:ribosomal protein S27E
MKRLSDSTLLDTWEAATTASPAVRPLMLLVAAEPDASIDMLEQLSIPERDARLLALRESLFGQNFQSIVTCEQCGERVEIAFETSDVQAVPPKSPLPFRVDGYEGTLRLPVSADWVALADEMDVASVSSKPANASFENLRHALARRCVLTVGPESSTARGGVSTATIDLPDAALDAVANVIAQADADTHTELNVTCPNCGHDWATLFDIASFLWHELDAHCRRLIDDVHCIARAYGWTESEILGLTPLRRARYLELIDHE